ncbi:DNA replication protein DnaC [Bradyrhizobium sp. USDA 3397]
MLTHPTLDQLLALGLHGMAKAFADIEAGGDAASLGHAEWLALLLEREASLRRDKRLSKRLQYAKLRQEACVEDIDYRTPRGLDRSLLTMLVEGRWIDDHANLLICGPSGVGKSWLASALGNKACRDNRSVLYQRVPRLFSDLALARGDGRHPAYCARSAASISSSSTTGASSRSTPRPATTSWRSSRTATATAPPSSPASFPSINGTR